MASRTGLFEPVGTHPVHRRKGFGLAVMMEGLRRLRALGAEDALVTRVGGNEAAARLYESV
ncbi:MAG: GNAT family N-acetyltransferase, partial [Rubrobacteraceae bacterium]